MHTVCVQIQDTYILTKIVHEVFGVAHLAVLTDIWLSVLATGSSASKTNHPSLCRLMTNHPSQHAANHWLL